MEYCIFQLYAPMVSWGDIAVGGERRSTRHPSKSAIIGLISAALGIRRDEEQRLNEIAESIGIGIKMHTGGSILKDFHTIQVPRQEKKVVYYTRKDELLAPSEKIGTILSKREYRCDAYSIVALWLKNKTFSLEGICSALKFPAFQLYFGRKSCVPALPLAPQKITAKTLSEAFDFVAFDFPSSIKSDKPKWLQDVFAKYPDEVLKNKSVTYFFEECGNPGFKILQKTTRYDMPLSRKRWQFVSRDEFMAMSQFTEADHVHE